MLNELLIVERGARQADVDMARLHPDVKQCGRIPTLLVRLDANGDVASVRPVPREVKPWTLRDGQHNSFPFVQRKAPLLAVPVDDERRGKAVDRRNDGRRKALLALADDVDLNPDAFADWPGAGLLNRLRDRRSQLATLDGTDANVVPATIDRFLLACHPSADGDAHRLLRAVTSQLVTELKQTAQNDWLEVAVALLLGRFNPKTREWESSGAMLFEADGSQASIVHSSVAIWVSGVLSQPQEAEDDPGKAGVCGLTGDKGTLLTGNFPQPNLPLLGQTFLFAKNKDIPANDRYGRLAAEAMPVGQDTAIRLAAAFRALTAPERKDITWRGVLGEARKQMDLLLAFVEAAAEAPVAGALAADDVEKDFSEESPKTALSASESVAAFEKRVQRLVDAVRAKVGADFRLTPVRLAVFRRVDPANRKVIYAGAPTVADLYEAATSWTKGERNIPPWLTLPVLRKGERKPHPMAPLHIAPLGVIPFTKQLFIRGGTKRQEVVGLAATEAFGLFLDSADAKGSQTRRRVERILRMVLARRAALISGSAHAQTRGFDLLKTFDRREALRTVTMLAVLLHKLGRTKEDYMSDTAFKLGQFLAAADVVHAGYCADVRRGDLPPSLLGNQVLTMAQTAPVKALATLSRRWKPYDGWAKKAARERDRADKLVKSMDKAEKQRGWDIRKALRHAREMGPLADDLGGSLRSCEVNDTFRAELLLGYLAGLPKAQDEDAGDRGDKSETMNTSGKEE